MHYTIASNGVAIGMPERWNGNRVITPWDATQDYFFVDISTLKFSEGTFLEDLNVWPGAEWLGDKPTWKSQPSDDRTNRAYVWRRQSDQKLVVVDKHGGIRLLHKELNWQLREPEMTEVAEYMFQIGVSARSVRTVDFAYHNLKRIQRECDTADLQSKIRSLNNKRKIMKRADA